ncbi:hypothetical protein ACFZAR_02435 [Streptomyces sp. NPDC008222]|uniref:hypothetical protein n=1 Tax=Streptomyces sp. NPDC008222 TaxID=3364820 RepID=UPI0036E2DBC4
MTAGNVPNSPCDAGFGSDLDDHRDQWRRQQAAGAGHEVTLQDHQVRYGLTGFVEDIDVLGPEASPPE